MASRRASRRRAPCLVILGSLAKLVQLTIDWAGKDVFTDTHSLVLATTFGVLGLQILSAVLFISIFSSRLSRFEDSVHRDGQHESQ